jgi:hypothetical protein
MTGNIIGSVRRNHALEHATISILLGRLGPGVRMVGRAARNGFYIYGDVPTDRVKESAAEGLARLKRGEASLAVSPLCGTNLAVAGLLAGGSSLLALGNRGRLERLPNVLLSAMVAVLAAQPLGRLVQRHLTTSPDLAGMEIVGVHEGGRGPARYHKVETRQRSS